MSQLVYEQLVVRLASDPAFAEHVRANPEEALAGFDLTPAETGDLIRLASTAAAPAASAPAAAPPPQQLAQRRSKSGILALGGAGAAVAIGAATFAGVNYLNKGGQGGVPAHPTIGYEAIQGHGQVEPGQVFSIELKCPDAKAPIGGGFGTDTQADPAQVATLRVSSNHPTARGWAVEATAKATLQLTTHVVCAAASDNTDVKAAFDGLLGVVVIGDGSVNAEAGQPASSKAGCPSADPIGRVPLAGGFSQASSDVVASTPDVTGWTVTLRGGASQSTAGIHVVCAVGAPDRDRAFAAGGVGWLTTASADVPVDPGHTETVDVACPNATTPAGGGFELQDGNLTLVGSTPTNGGWEITAANPPGSPPGVVRARAVCVI